MRERGGRGHTENHICCFDAVGVSLLEGQTGRSLCSSPCHVEGRPGCYIELGIREMESCGRGTRSRCEHGELGGCCLARRIAELENVRASWGKRIWTPQ
jgi:hypothetical protein